MPPPTKESEPVSKHKPDCICVSCEDARNAPTVTVKPFCDNCGRLMSRSEALASSTCLLCQETSGKPSPTVTVPREEWERIQWVNNEVSKLRELNEDPCYEDREAHADDMLAAVQEMFERLDAQPNAAEGK
jgi:hypothetical protein